MNDVLTRFIHSTDPAERHLLDITITWVSHPSLQVAGMWSCVIVTNAGRGHRRQFEGVGISIYEAAGKAVAAVTGET